MDDVMPSTLRIFRAAAASADRLVVYDDDDDVMMMEWAFGETLQKVTKSYGNSTPSTPSHRRDDDDDDLSLSLGFALHATRSATDGNHHRIFHEEYSGGESGGGGEWVW